MSPRFQAAVWASITARMSLSVRDCDRSDPAIRISNKKNTMDFIATLSGKEIICGPVSDK
jgi:hypothetical protein